MTLVTKDANGGNGEGGNPDPNAGDGGTGTNPATPKANPDGVKAVHEVWEQMKGALDDRDKEAAKNRDVVSAETDEKLDKLNDAIDKRIDAIEAKSNRPDLGNGGENPEADEQRDAFINWVTKGVESPEFLKAVTSDGSEGGFTIPQNLEEMIVAKLIEIDPMREISTLMTIDNGESLDVPREGATDSVADWATEEGSVSATQTDSIELTKISVHELSAFPLITNKMIRSSAIDMEAWLADIISRRFMTTEGAAFVAGSGAGRPLGVLEDDQITGLTSAVSGVVDMDDVLETIYDLEVQYRANATLLAHRTLIKTLRTEREGASNGYLWQPPVGDAPQSVDGFPLMDATSMPQVASGSKSLVVGDFTFYWIVDQMGMKIVRDEVTQKPHVGLYVTKAVGGAPVQPEAFRILTTKA